MTVDPSKKYRLRGYPESEVRGLWSNERGTFYGWYRSAPGRKWEPARWFSNGAVVDTSQYPDDLDLIPVPRTVKTKGFWLAVNPLDRTRLFRLKASAEHWADIGNARSDDPDTPQGAIEYFPPREYEAGSIIDPREEG